MLLRILFSLIYIFTPLYSMHPLRPDQLNQLDKAARGYFFGGDYFTSRLDNFYRNGYALTRAEAKNIAKTAKSYQIFSFMNEQASQMQVGLGICTVLCVFPAMFGIAHKCPSVTTGSIGVVGLLLGTIGVTEIAKQINSKNDMRIHGIECALERKIPNYVEQD